MTCRISEQQCCLEIDSVFFCLQLDELFLYRLFLVSTCPLEKRVLNVFDFYSLFFASEEMEAISCKPIACSLTDQHRTDFVLGLGVLFFTRNFGYERAICFSMMGVEHFFRCTKDTLSDLSVFETAVGFSSEVEGNPNGFIFEEQRPCGRIWRSSHCFHLVRFARCAGRRRTQHPAFGLTHF